MGWDSGWGVGFPPHRKQPHDDMKFIFLFSFWLSKFVMPIPYPIPPSPPKGRKTLTTLMTVTGNIADISEPATHTTHTAFLPMCYHFSKENPLCDEESWREGDSVQFPHPLKHTAGLPSAHGLHSLSREAQAVEVMCQIHTREYLHRLPSPTSSTPSILFLFSSSSTPACAHTHTHSLAQEVKRCEKELCNTESEGGRKE